MQCASSSQRTRLCVHTGSGRGTEQTAGTWGLLALSLYCGDIHVCAAPVSEEPGWRRLGCFRRCERPCSLMHGRTHNSDLGCGVAHFLFPVTPMFPISLRNP